MSRDDFSEQVKNAVANRVGRICSNIDCRAPTSGPQVDPGKVLNVGVAAHITAASEGGPRYDGSLSTEQRCAIENAIWLCQNCAKLVDNDPARYDVDLLRAWKKIAEYEALHNIGKTKPRADFAAAEDARARQMYAMAIHLLRRVCGKFFNNNNIPVFLFGDPQNNRPFWRTVQDLGELDGRARFTPYTEPSGFQVHDGPSLKAAAKIIRGYIAAPTSYPDYERVREQYELPDPEEVRSLLPE